MENEITDLIQSTSQENLSEKDEEEGPNLLLINVRSLADQSSSGENDQITPPPNKKSSTSLAKDDSGSFPVLVLNSPCIRLQY